MSTARLAMRPVHGAPSTVHSVLHWTVVAEILYATVRSGRSGNQYPGGALCR